ncbi:unnamed protein product [Closterium sp. NIES-64]|nr:unnamed protein product [Closterium sp. NIES-64]
MEGERCGGDGLTEPCGAVSLLDIVLRFSVPTAASFRPAPPLPPFGPSLANSDVARSSDVAEETHHESEKRRSLLFSRCSKSGIRGFTSSKRLTGGLFLHWRATTGGSKKVKLALLATTSLFLHWRATTKGSEKSLPSLEGHTKGSEKVKLALLATTGSLAAHGWFSAGWSPDGKMGGSNVIVMDSPSSPPVTADLIGHAVSVTFESTHRPPFPRTYGSPRSRTLLALEWQVEASSSDQAHCSLAAVTSSSGQPVKAPPLPSRLPRLPLARSYGPGRQRQRPRRAISLLTLHWQAATPSSDQLQLALEAKKGTPAAASWFAVGVRGAARWAAAM